MYDAFSGDYDRFVNWEARLAGELPFLTQALAGRTAVLDAACGTGRHTLALARQGFQACGADLSGGMIEQARRNARRAGLEARFEAAGFGALARTFAPGAFDALLCLGNSLPHVAGAPELAEALADFAACLRPGGLLVLQNRNFDQVMAARERWMEPQPHREEDREWLFLRFYDFLADGRIDFNVATLKRASDGPWEQTTAVTRLYPLLRAELTAALERAGFTRLRLLGGLADAPFDAARSGNLVILAEKG